MNWFDFTIVHFLNAYAHRSWTLDALIAIIEESNLLKGGIVLGLFWWAWFRYEKADLKKRELLLFAFASSSCALLSGRFLSLCIPYRERPLHNPQYHFQVPYTVTGDVHSWNSAPSDHAVLFFCLATALWMVSRRLGFIAVCHALLIVCLPRIYVGYHYPTDILSGAVLGIGVAFLSKFGWLRKSISRPAFHLLEKWPPLFYALAFVWTFEVAELFESLLAFQSFARKSLGALLQFHF
jgi:undecaprenyl-diphosphatase